MSTLVCFHAHPDDEAIATAGVMAQAAAAGHTVVLVVATRGELGEVEDGFLEPGETLAQRRERESHAAAEVLGVHRVEFLGYCDSGMEGEATNEDAACFWQADIEEASDRLAAILREVGCDVLTVYDERGNYGHPDHVQVHRVGVRAAEKAGVTEIYESTANRDFLYRAWQQAREAGVAIEGPRGEDSSGEPDFEWLGCTEDQITHGVDVRDVTDLKRKAMRAHASQISENSFFLQMPDVAFREAFGWEWFIRHGTRRAPGEPMGDRILDA